MEGFKGIDPIKSKYEQRIWAKAEELSDLRTRLTEKSEAIFEKIQSGKVGAIGLEAERIKSELQGEYFEILEDIEEIKKQEAKLEELLVSLGSGNFDSKELDRFLGLEDGERLSKRKQWLLRQRQETGVDPRDGTDIDTGIGVDSYITKQVGPGSNRITTGHHIKKLKGNLGQGAGNEINLTRDFFRATQDSHGGKAGYGKKGDGYVSSTGRRIRKR